MANANRRRVWIGSGARMDKCGVECEVAWLSVRVGSLPSVGSALPSARDLALGKLALPSALELALGKD